MVYVKKRNGRYEPFDRFKIKASLSRAGASEAEAENITMNAELWVRELGQDVVSSDDLLEEVMRLIRLHSKKLAESYENFTTTPEGIQPEEPEKEEELPEGPVA